MKRKERSPVSEWSAKGEKQKKRSVAYFSASEPICPTPKDNIRLETTFVQSNGKKKWKRPKKEPEVHLNI